MECQGFVSCCLVGTAVGMESKRTSWQLIHICLFNYYLKNTNRYVLTIFTYFPEAPFNFVTTCNMFTDAGVLKQRIVNKPLHMKPFDRFFLSGW